MLVVAVSGSPFDTYFPSSNCSVIPSDHLPCAIVQLSGPHWAACIFNRNSNPLTLLQLNFQAPKHTLTLKPTRTRTGLSINLPRSWTRRALRLSEWLEQVSLAVSGCSRSVRWTTPSAHRSRWQPNIYTLSESAASLFIDNGCVHAAQMLIAISMTSNALRTLEQTKMHPAW